jgi:hypothetical protein
MFTGIVDSPLVTIWVALTQSSIYIKLRVSLPHQPRSGWISQLLTQAWATLRQIAAGAFSRPLMYAISTFYVA